VGDETALPTHVSHPPRYDVMPICRIAPLTSCLLFIACQQRPPSVILETNQQLADQVRATEQAFAKTMAHRDFAAFTGFIADEAVFFTGPTPLRGKAAVTARWQQFYEKPDAPFRWEVGKVEVLSSGTLALSTGPVFTADGKTAASFTSIWRRTAQGHWEIIFDKGCDCPDE